MIAEPDDRRVVVPLPAPVMTSFVTSFVPRTVARLVTRRPVLARAFLVRRLGISIVPGAVAGLVTLGPLFAPRLPGRLILPLRGFLTLQRFLPRGRLLPGGCFLPSGIVLPPGRCLARLPARPFGPGRGGIARLGRGRGLDGVSLGALDRIAGA